MNSTYKNVFITAVIALAVLATTPLLAQRTNELDLAIREASDHLNQNIPSGNKVVFLNIESTSNELSNYIIDELVANAVRDKNFTVVDRKEIDAIREEQNLQLSGQVSDATAVRIGQIFGANTIVSGRVSTMGEGYRISARAVDVQSTEVIAQFNKNIETSPTINALLGLEYTAPTTPSTPTTPPPTTPSYSGEYNIGDPGPAGGIVFYDKGDTSGGWRYLEAAPADTEFSAEWGLYGTDILNTSTGIGTGMANTTAIVEAIVAASAGQMAPITNTAAQRCDALEFGGFDDWFLPSKDELNLMYENIEGFNTTGRIVTVTYWSSSAYRGHSRYYTWTQRFSDGVQDLPNTNIKRTDALRVRAVRAF